MTKLQMALLANAAFSTLSGLILSIFSVQMARIFGIQQNGIFIFLGVGLILFAALVFLESRKKPVNPLKIKSIIYADISWVLGSLLIIVFQLFQLTDTGYLLIAIVGIIVSLFAFLQSRGLKALLSQTA